LEAKLHRPSARLDWVHRTRLLSALDLATGRRLTLVAAPAGYGKTTIVAQWLSQLSDRAVAWVGLDVADNDPVRLWTHLGTALSRAGCVIDDESRIASYVAANATEMLTEVLPRIINSLAALPDDILVILDDFHFIQNGACQAQVDFLIGHLPASVRLMIITRADPGLHLGRLRAAGELAEIRADQLAFDADEVASLLAVEGVTLPDGAVVELMNRTEGWPAGIYLAALSLTGRPDPAASVRLFSGGNRFIGDYLSEEVLSRQSDAVRAFILDVSIFDRFSAPLCDYVTRSTSSRGMLQDLERSNLFLVPLDGERQWFRFHHLFAVVARGELELTDRDRVRALHARAAEWFAEHGFADEAISHALAAGSGSRAAALIDASWVRYVDAGRLATVGGWLDALTALEHHLEPAALVTAAWVAGLSGNEESFHEFMGQLAGVPGDDQLPDGTRSLESAVALLRSMFGFGGPTEMLSAARRAVELETDASSPWYGFATFALGHVQYATGDLDAAMTLLPKSAYNAATPAAVKILALSTMALAQAERGRPEQSSRHAAEAIAVVESGSMGGMPQASMAFMVRGQQQAVAGDVSAAMATLERGLLLRRKLPGLSPWPTMYHLLTMGRVATLAGDLALAESLLEEAGQLMSRFDEGMDVMHARLSAARSGLRQRRSTEADVEPLTGREVDVLRLLQGSMTLRQMASAMFVSVNTVKTHAQAVYRKLGARSRREAVRIARQRGLI
jgi:LuxR family transcriptional regulator, maltose regulon positive regulatory protein